MVSTIMVVVCIAAALMMIGMFSCFFAARKCGKQGERELEDRLYFASLVFWGFMMFFGFFNLFFVPFCVAFGAI